MNNKIGFYGSGNMAEAIINGITKTKLYSSDQILAYDTDVKRLEYIKDAYRVTTAADPAELFASADYVVLAVKPQVLTDIKETFININFSGLLISVVAGVSINTLQSLFPSAGIVRTMPNMPSLIAEGMTGISYAVHISHNQQHDVETIFGSIGKVLVFKEEQLAAVTGVSGSGPAYVYMFAEAMADAAVLCGLSRKDAYILAAQTLAGSARMLQETNKHPGELKDMVTSPGGTTIEALQSLEKNGFRNAVMEAVIKSCEKSKQL